MTATVALTETGLSPGGTVAFVMIDRVMVFVLLGPSVSVEGFSETEIPGVLVQVVNVTLPWKELMLTT